MPRSRLTVSPPFLPPMRPPLRPASRTVIAPGSNRSRALARPPIERRVDILVVARRIAPALRVVMRLAAFLLLRPADLFVLAIALSSPRPSESLDAPLECKGTPAPAPGGGPRMSASRRSHQKAEHLRSERQRVQRREVGTV